VHSSTIIRLQTPIPGHLDGFLPELGIVHAVYQKRSLSSFFGMTLSGYFHQYMLEMRSERREFLERFEEGPLL